MPLICALFILGCLLIQKSFLIFWKNDDKALHDFIFFYLFFFILLLLGSLIASNTTVLCPLDNQTSINLSSLSLIVVIQSSLNLI